MPPHIWQDIALVAVIHTIGGIFFGHFEVHTPKWRKVAKVIAVLAVTAAISTKFGHTGVYITLGAMILGVVYIHGIWLPKHGINGWTGEPKDKYYALRGWTQIPPP